MLLLAGQEVVEVAGVDPVWVEEGVNVGLPQRITRPIFTAGSSPRVGEAYTDR